MELSKEWINAENEPPFSKRVLVVWNRRVDIGFLTTSYEWCDDNGRVVQTKPTLWQPLPEPPDTDRRQREQP
jgi:hypothetical protein